MKFASFDLEISTELPDGAADWKAYRPLGISCAAVHLSDRDNVETWQAYGRLRMPHYQAETLVSILEGLVLRGYTLLAWNGLGFDFDVLAEESGQYGRCKALALDSVDPMFQLVAERGHYLGLETAATGLALPGKVKAVKLNDGTTLEGMHGGMAPKLWAAGETEAVLFYLRQDVRVTTRVAEAILQRGSLPWTSSRGRGMVHQMKSLLTVRQCLELPRLVNPLVSLEKVAGWIMERPDYSPAPATQSRLL